jgi:hypothetical protein
MQTDQVLPGGVISIGEFCSAPYLYSLTLYPVVRQQTETTIPADILISGRCIVLPELPMELSLAVNASLVALSKYGAFSQSFSVEFSMLTCGEWAIALHGRILVPVCAIHYYLIIFEHIQQVRVFCHYKIIAQSHLKSAMPASSHTIIKPDHLDVTCNCSSQQNCLAWCSLEMHLASAPPWSVTPLIPSKSAKILHTNISCL